jgi:hypothetical protein
LPRFKTFNAERETDRFEENIFRPLETADDAGAAIDNMFDAVEQYYRSGQRACLAGAMALDSSRDTFADEIFVYFERWATTLSDALQRSGFPLAEADRLSCEVIGGIQGAIVFSRALNQINIFAKTILSLRSRCRRVQPLR